MFTPEDRTALRSHLLEAAAADSRISGAAITGSASQDREDRWSDIDLAFGVADPNLIAAVLSDWTARLYNQHAAVHHMDVVAGNWIYRVFLLPNTLQVDLAFAPEHDFRATSPTFRLVSGKANKPEHRPPSDPEELIGWAWLYALHARTCIARGKFWQAEYMVSGARDHALALACLRHGLSTYHGRGFDNLPEEVVAPFNDGLVQRLDALELSRAFSVVMELLLTEIRLIDRGLEGRLAGPLRMMFTRCDRATEGGRL